MLRVLSFYLDGVDHNLEQGVYMYREFFFIFFLSELVLVPVGVEVDNVLLTN